MKLMFPVNTIHGEQVMIVDKEPLGSQGRVLLTADDGEKYVADLSGQRVTPVAEYDLTAQGVTAEQADAEGVGADLNSAESAVAPEPTPETQPERSEGTDGDGTQLVV